MRPSKVWYWEARRKFFVTINGTRHGLGPDEANAHRRFHLLMAGVGGPPAVSPSSAVVAPRLTIGKLFEAYLIDLKTRVGDRTHYVAGCYLKPFLKLADGWTVDQVKKRDVEAFVRGRAGWNQSTRYHVLCQITARFNWAVAEDLIPANPLRGLKKPTPRRRGSEVVMSDADFDRFHAAAPGYLQDVLVALRDSGARPGEVLRVEAKDFDAASAAWVLTEHKTAHSTGENRVIHLTPRLVKLSQALAANNPTGPLFRRKSGKPFPPGYYLARLVRNLRRKLGLSESLIPYSLRHAYGTGLLAAGTPDAIVSKLMGHSTPAILHRAYAHLGQRTRELKAHLANFRGS
jgi:integrase